MGRGNLAFFIWHFLYILSKSQSSGKYYCGQSSDLDRRLQQDNDPKYRLTKTTKRFEGPWKVIWSRDCSNRSSAVKLEKTIKKRGIGRYLEDQQSS